MARGSSLPSFSIYIYVLYRKKDSGHLYVVRRLRCTIPVTSPKLRGAKRPRHASLTMPRSSSLLRASRTPSQPLTLRTLCQVRSRAVIIAAPGRITHHDWDRQPGSARANSPPGKLRPVRQRIARAVGGDDLLAGIILAYMLHGVVSSANREGATGPPRSCVLRSGHYAKRPSPTSAPSASAFCCRSASESMRSWLARV
jgi:hypothetical protein